MTQIKKSMAVVVVLTAVFVFLTACGGGSGSGGEDNALLGKWSMNGGEVAGETVDMEELSALGFDMTFDFQDNGVVMIESMGMSQEASYTTSGSTVTVDDGYDKYDLALSGNTLTLEMDLDIFVVTLTFAK